MCPWAFSKPFAYTMFALEASFDNKLCEDIFVFQKPQICMGFLSTPYNT